MRKFFGVVKWIVGVGIVLVVICGGGAAFLVPMVQKQIKAQQERAKGTLVVVEPAAMGELIRTISAPGVVAPKNTANISSRVSAKIEKIHVDVGDQVEEGQILVELDKQDWLAALDASKARLAADEASLKSIEASLASDEARIVGARASYTFALTDLERQQELFASGDISQQNLDNARTEVDRTKSTYEAAMKNLDAARANIEAARARVDASRAEVERSQRNVEYCTVRAPFSGVITVRRANEGETALGTIQNLGTTLMVLDDMSELQVDARLAETDSPRVSIGQKVRVFINGYPDQSFEGEVRRVGLSTQRWQQDNTFYIECEIVVDVRGKRVASSTTSNVEIEIETIKDLIVVPSQAVLDKRVDALPQKLREGHPLIDKDKTFAKIAMLYKDGKIEYVPVKTVASNITKTAITEGLSVGDPLVVGPFSALQSLTDGANVRTEEEKKKNEEKDKDKPEVAETEKGETKTAKAS